MQKELEKYQMELSRAMLTNLIEAGISSASIKAATNLSSSTIRKILINGRKAVHYHTVKEIAHFYYRVFRPVVFIDESITRYCALHRREVLDCLTIAETLLTNYPKFANDFILDHSMSGQARG